MKKGLLLALFTFISGVAYATGAFQATSQEPVLPTTAVPALKNYSTSIQIFGSETDGHWAYNGSEKKVSFLEQYGTVTAKDIFTGVTIGSSGTLSYKYFDSASSDSIGIYGAATLRFNTTTNDYTNRSVAITATQHLFSNLFIRLHMRIAEQQLTQAVTATGTDATNAKVVAFLNDFDNLLVEQGHPKLSKNTWKAHAEQTTLLMGWSGQMETPDYLITEFGGMITGGYQFQPSAFVNHLAPAFLPHNITDGFVANMSGYLRIAKHFRIDLDVANIVYLPRSGTAHIVRDETAGTTWFSGPILLGKGFVKKDPGTLWKAHAALCVDRFFGLFGSIGYDFSYQERTYLTLKDATVMTTLSATPSVQNERINSDPRLKRWKHHAIVFTLGVRPDHRSYRFVPEITCMLAYPLLGRRSIRPNYTFGGSASLSIQWTF